MREEWSSGSFGKGLIGRPAPSSLSPKRLMVVAAIMSVVALVIGFGLGQLVAPARSFGPAPVAAAPALPAPLTDIGDAVTATRSGSFDPAPVEHLTVVEVSVNVCGTRSAGTAVLVADGILLTAAHLVGDAGLVRIDYLGATLSAEVLGVFVDGRDIALLSLDAPLDVALETAPAPALGAAITLVGHPGGGRRTISVGPRVNVAPSVAAAVGGDPMGVNVEIEVGFSGGPAVDSSGRLVGIVVASETQTGTALVAPLSGIDRLDQTALAPGRCPAEA